MTGGKGAARLPPHLPHPLPHPALIVLGVGLQGGRIERQELLAAVAQPLVRRTVAIEKPPGLRVAQH